MGWFDGFGATHSAAAAVVVSVAGAGACSGACVAPDASLPRAKTGGFKRTAKIGFEGGKLVLAGLPAETKAIFKQASKLKKQQTGKGLTRKEITSILKVYGAVLRDPSALFDAAMDGVPPPVPEAMDKAPPLVPNYDPATLEQNLVVKVAAFEQQYTSELERGQQSYQDLEVAYGNATESYAEMQALYDTLRGEVVELEARRDGVVQAVTTHAAAGAGRGVGKSTGKSFSNGAVNAGGGKGIGKGQCKGKGAAAPPPPPPPPAPKLKTVTRPGESSRCDLLASIKGVHKLGKVEVPHEKAATSPGDIFSQIRGGAALHHNSAPTPDPQAADPNDLLAAIRGAGLKALHHTVEPALAPKASAQDDKRSELAAAILGIGSMINPDRDSSDDEISDGEWENDED